MDRPPIDLHALFAPRSVAVVGASPRSDIAQTVRDNLLTMGSTTTCYFVNPKYDEAWGSPCYPDLASLPEPPDSVLVALNPLRAASVTEEAARVGARSVLIPGGGVVEGGPAAARMQREVREIALRHGLAILGPNCMGMIDRTSNSAVYIGDINPWAPRGHVAGIAQSGSVTDAFIHFGTRIGFSRIIGAGSEVVLDLCDYLAYCLDDPETDAIILFVEGFKRPERFLALADRALELGKPILALKGGPQPAGPGRRGCPFGLARRRGTGDRRRAGGGGRRALRRPRRPVRGRRAACRLPPAGSACRPRPDRHRDRLDRRGLADRRHRRAGWHRPAGRARVGPGRDPGRATHPRLHRQPDRPVGHHRRTSRLSGRARSIRRLQRLRRPGNRPRLPVSLAEERGGGGRGGDPGAHRGDRRPAGGSARVRLADLGRADPGDRGHARRGGRRARPAGHDRSPRRNRRAGGLGSAPVRAAG